MVELCCLKSIYKVGDRNKSVVVMLRSSVK